MQWTLRGVTGGVGVDLSSDDGATWARLSDEVENVGFDWTGVGADLARRSGHQLTNPERRRPRPASQIVSDAAHALLQDNRHDGAGASAI